MPASYQAPRRDDGSRDKTTSQSLSTNTQNKIAKIQDILDRRNGDLFTISEADTIASAVKVLRDKRIGALIVTNDTGSMVGILSERDIVRKLAETPGNTLPQTVSENMTRKVMTCEPEDALVEVLRRMSEGRFRHMPVMKSDELLGIVTIGDVVNYRLDELEYEALQLKQLIVG
ncbi:MAG: CBS domain-containing protein [Pseudomonadota bacterium]